MCDKCELDLAMYGEVASGFRCADVTEGLLAEEVNGIARFPNRSKGGTAKRDDEGSKGAKPGTDGAAGR